MGTISLQTQVRDNIVGVIIGINSYKLCFSTIKEAEKFHKELISAKEHQNQNVAVFWEEGSGCVKVCFNTTKTSKFEIPFTDSKAKSFSEDLTALFKQQ